MSKELLKQAFDALELMKEEFRGYDLPYGSKAYAKANEVSHAIFAELTAWKYAGQTPPENDGFGGSNRSSDGKWHG